VRGSAENERRTGVDLERLEYIEDGVWDRRNGEAESGEPERGGGER